MSDILSAVGDQISGAFGVVAAGASTAANEVRNFGGRAYNFVSPAIFFVADKVNNFFKSIPVPGFVSNAVTAVTSHPLFRPGATIATLAAGVGFLVWANDEQDQFWKFAKIALGLTAIATSVFLAANPITASIAPAVKV